MEKTIKLGASVTCRVCQDIIPAGTTCFAQQTGPETYAHRHLDCPVEQTNLQAAGGSVVAAFEVFDKLNSRESFAVWCDAKATPKIPNWLKPGQWIRITGIAGTLIRKIERYDSATKHVWYTNDCYDELAVLHCSVVTPVTIKPWSLAEAEAAMDAGVKIRIYIDQAHPIIQVGRHKRHDAVLYLEDRVYPTAQIARDAETEGHEPCGTPVPM